MKKQNNLGQFTKEMSILIPKELQNLAHEAEVRIKPILRDKLEQTHRLNVRETYTSTSTGKYYHNSNLIPHIKGIIDENTVKAVVEKVKLPDNVRSPHAIKLTTELYDALKYGTTARPRTDSYPYQAKDGSVKWSKYTRQLPHDFEQRTLDDMEDYINQDLIPALTKKEGYLYKQLVKKYTDKIAKKNKMV